MTADDGRHLDERGFVVLPALRTISNDVLLHLETVFELAGENFGHRLREEPFARVVKICGGDAGNFEPLARDAQVLEHVRRRLGADFELAALHARSMNPFALALDPPRRFANPAACRVLWLLDDFQDEGAAALRVIPGSQLWPAGRETAFDEPAAVAVSGAAGSAIILDGRLWTAQGFNPGNRHLRMLCCDYEPRC